MSEQTPAVEPTIVTLGAAGLHVNVMRQGDVIQCLDCGRWLQGGPLRALNRVPCIELPDETPLSELEVKP